MTRYRNDNGSLRELGDVEHEMANEMFRNSTVLYITVAAIVCAFTVIVL